MATYRDAGVDLEAAEVLVNTIGRTVTESWGDRVVGGFGGFAAGIRLPQGYRQPVLMMSTDGVGTKAEVARRAGMLDGLGADLVAMCVDDLAAAGARPIAMTDYIAVGELDVAMVERIVASIASACRAAGVALLGGETAEHPGVMEPDAFDLAAAALGIVEEGSQIDGSTIGAGDVALGLESPNLRSNGFSLIRRAVLPALDLAAEFPGTDATTAEVLLEPSVVYSPAVQPLLDAVPVHGMAHITGGGIAGNLVRILPNGLAAVLDTSTWTPPHVFEVISAVGDIERREMFATFNMGIGFIVVLPAGEVATATEVLAGAGHDTKVIGEIRAGETGVDLV